MTSNYSPGLDTCGVDEPVVDSQRHGHPDDPRSEHHDQHLWEFGVPREQLTRAVERFAVLGSKLRELESLGVDGRHWETSGDTNSGCWKGLEYSGVTRRHQESLGVVEVVVVHSPTIHLCPSSCLFSLLSSSYLCNMIICKGVGCGVVSNVGLLLPSFHLCNVLS